MPKGIKIAANPIQKNNVATISFPLVLKEYARSPGKRMAPQGARKERSPPKYAAKKDTVIILSVYQKSPATDIGGFFKRY